MSYDLKFVADVTGVAAGLQKIPGMSEKAAASAALKQATASKKAAEQTKNVWEKAAKDIEKNAKNIFGGVVGDAVDVVDAFGTIGLKGVAMGGVLSAVAVGAGALAASFVDVLMRADELAPKLEALTGQEIISKEAIADAKVAEQQIGNLSTVASGFAGVLVDKYAPSVETATSATVGLGAGAVGLYSDFGDLATSITGPVVNAMTDLNLAINPVAIGLKSIADNGREANEALQAGTEMTAEAYAASAKYHKEQDDAHLAKVKADREEAEALKDLAAGEKIRAQLAREAAKTREAAEKQMLAAHLAGIAVVEAADDAEFAAFKDRQKEFVAAAKQKELDIAAAHFAVQDAIEAADDAEMAAFIQRSTDREKKVQEEQDAAAAAVLGAASAMADAIGQVATMYQDTHTARLTQLQDELKEVQRTARLAAKASGAREAIIADSQKSGIDKRIKNEKRMIIAGFVAQQTAAVSAIGMQTAVAVMTALAQLGPVAGGIAAGLIIGTGALQAGMVLAQKPPKFARGGEVQVTAENGEGIANKRAMAKPSFRKALDDANEGRSSGGSDGTSIFLNDRLLMVVYGRMKRLAGEPIPSSLARAM